MKYGSSKSELVNNHSWKNITHLVSSEPPKRLEAVYRESMRNKTVVMKSEKLGLA